METMERKARNLRETADIIGVHPQTVRRLIADGRIDVVRIGRRVLVPVAEIERFLDRTARG